MRGVREEINWDVFMLQKPPEGVNHPEDEFNLNKAKETIGDYRLKMSDKYKVPPNLRETTIKKFKQILEIRHNQFNLRHTFSAKIYALRDRKQEVLTMLREKLKQLKEIHQELPEDLQKFGPEIPDKDLSEFPELDIEIKLESVETEVLSEDVDDLEAEQPFIEQPSEDEIEKQTIPESATFPQRMGDYFRYSLKVSQPKSIAEQDFENLLQTDEDANTMFEEEMRTMRLNRKNFKQQLIIGEMNLIIDEFNEEMAVVKDERIEILVNGNFIDLFILTLYQELKILKDFEDVENALSADVQTKLSNLRDMEDVIQELKDAIDQRNGQIELYHADEKRIYEKFNQTTQDNKYYSFLRRVFRKKFKPPKIKAGEDSSSDWSSSSSSSSDDSEESDVGSVDSKDFAIFKQDINVCPKGCEHTIFDLTVSLRSQRHQIEQFVMDEVKFLDSSKKEYEINMKKLVAMQNQFKSSHLELESLQREKQRKLNRVRCVVVVNLSQILQFSDERNIFPNVLDVLVFSKTTLTNLYKRIESLNHETIKQKSQHDMYIKHLTRMKKDVDYMEYKIKSFKNVINNAMIEKFGHVVNIETLEISILQRKFKKNKINDLEEVVMKKLIFDLRLKLTDVKAMFIDEIKLSGKRVRNAQKELLAVLKENTKKMELLSLINKEKTDLHKIIAVQPQKKEQFMKIENCLKDVQQDLDKLEDVIEDQCAQIHDLKGEITMLKTKGLPPPKPVICTPPKPHVGKAEEATDVKDWVEYDQYIGEQGDEAEKKEEKKIHKETLTPIFIAAQSEDVVSDLLNQMLGELNSELKRKSNENIVRNILSGILRCTSVTEIINEIVNNLPFEPSEDHKSIIESTAEQLYIIQEPEITEEDIVMYAQELLEDIIDETLLIQGEPHEVLTRIVENLLESLPLDFLNQKDSIQLIVDKILHTIIEFDIDKDGLVKRLESSASVRKDEMKTILNMILQKVYGTGIDYLYFIK